MWKRSTLTLSWPRIRCFRRWIGWRLTWATFTTNWDCIRRQLRCIEWHWIRFRVTRRNCDWRLYVQFSQLAVNPHTNADFLLDSQHRRTICPHGTIFRCSHQLWVHHVWKRWSQKWASSDLVLLCTGKHWEDSTGVPVVARGAHWIQWRRSDCGCECEFETLQLLMHI